MKKKYININAFLLKCLYLLLVSVLLTSCHSPSQSNDHQLSNQPLKETTSIPSKSFSTFTTELAANTIRSSPLEATFSFGDLEAIGMDYLLTQLDDLSLEAYNKGIIYNQKVIDALSQYDYDTLSTEEQLTYDALSFYYNNAYKYKDFYYYSNTLQPTSGIQINIPLALMQIELKSTADVDAYLIRLKKLPKLIDQVIAYEEERANLGLLLPEYLYDEVILQIDSLLVTPENFLMTLSFKDKLNDLNLKDSEKANYIEQYLDIVRGDIYPSYNKLRESINQYKSNGSDCCGLATWPKGKEYYELIIQEKTSYDMTISEFKSWIQSQKATTLNEIINLYEEHPSLIELTNPYDVLPTYSSLEDIYIIEKKCLNELFYDYAIDLASENIIPDYLEKHLAGGFYFPIALDKKAYGNMYLRSDTYSNIDFYTLNLYFHENIPGHHLYFSYLADSDLPLIRKLNSWLPYEEGFAVYIEQYAYDYIGLAPEVATLLKLNDQYYNYIILENDVRIHYDGESIDSIKYELINEGFAPEHIDNILNRMIANPGETIHYHYGAYKFESYLEKSRKALGDHFDIKAFHDILLKNAGLPFCSLDQVIDNWITNNK